MTNIIIFSFEKKIVRLKQQGNHPYGFSVRGGICIMFLKCYFVLSQAKNSAVESLLQML